MTLIEFIKHPAYNYYITTLVHDCLLIDWKITNAFKDKNIKNITIRDYNKYSYNKYRNDNK